MIYDGFNDSQKLLKGGVRPSCAFEDRNVDIEPPETGQKCCLGDIREDTDESPSYFFRFLNLQNRSVAAEFDSCSE